MSSVVDVIIPALTTLSMQESAAASKMLSLIAKLHSRSPLNKNQLALVRGCRILSVTNTDGSVSNVARDDFDALYDCCPSVDQRLLNGSAFIAAGERTKEVALLLEALGVEFLDEKAFYSKILLPHLEEVSGGGGVVVARPLSPCTSLSPSTSSGLSNTCFIATANDSSDCCIDTETGAQTKTHHNSSRPDRGHAMMFYMFQDVKVLGDFLEETLARIETRYAKPGDVLEGFSSKLQQLAWLPTEACDADAQPDTCESVQERVEEKVEERRMERRMRLARPCDLRDPHDACCRTLFPAHRFPCAALQARPAAMAALRRLGLCARVCQNDLESDVYPPSWKGREVIAKSEWTPGVAGEPTLPQIYAAWTLCPQAERHQALALSSKGRLIRGFKCTELLPACIHSADNRRAQGDDGSGGGWTWLLERLGVETIYMQQDYDFSKSLPPYGYMMVTPASLLNLFVSNKGAVELDVLSCSDRQLLLRFLISPLQDSREVTTALEQDTPQATTQVCVCVCTRARRTFI